MKTAVDSKAKEREVAIAAESKDDEEDDKNDYCDEEGDFDDLSD